MKQPNIGDMIDLKKAELTDKILDFYDGEQTEHMEKLLSDPAKGRKDWRKRGLIPRSRNIMKMIVDKSGLLFNDKAPKLDVYSGGNVDEAQSTILQQMFENIDWVEFFTNFDSTVRMLKTACILVQFDKETDQLVLDVLTQQNCAVVMNRFNRKIDTLIYNVYGEDEDEDRLFRVFTNETIQDILVQPNGDQITQQVVPNVFGIIPLAVFHDTNVPRCDFWNEIPTDLLQINELYNLHIIDSEYSMSWNKYQTLITNAEIGGNVQGGQAEFVDVGQKLPELVFNNGGVIVGPSDTMVLKSMPGETVFAEFKGPNVDLLPLDTMVNKWVADFAADWAVNVKDANGGVADSGFKLVVEEMPNLELRKKRQRMMEAGFKRLFKVIKSVVGYYYPNMFTEDAELFATFAAPALPIDENQDEILWDRKIAGGRASRVDYFMQKFGMTRDEAIAKVTEIDNDMSAKAASVNIQKFNVALTKGQQ
jgi:hypothetical protein